MGQSLGMNRVLRAVLAAGLFSLVAEAAFAIPVTTTTDENGTNPAACSLREAVAAINTGASFGGCTWASGDSVVLLPAGTYPFTFGGPSSNQGLTLQAAMTIRGAGQALTLLDATDLYDLPVMFMTMGFNIVVEDLTVANRNAADQLPTLYFAATSQSSSLTLRDVTIRDNIAGVSAGLYIAGGPSPSAVTLERVRFENNESSGIGFEQGSAIHCASSAAGIDLSIRDSVFVGNHLDDMDKALGGAIYNDGCNLTLENVTFDGNSADGDTGGCPPAGGICHPVTAGGGGLASFSRAGTNNQVRLTNVTFFGNHAGQFGVGGGALFADNSSGTQTVTLTNVTFAGNTSTLDGDDLYVEGNGSVTLTNVLFGSGPRGDCFLFSAVTSGGGNLDTDGTCALGGPGDQTVANPGLDTALGNHGGLTPTLALLPGSPAIDGGTNTGCPATDQRAEPRPQDGDFSGPAVCDVGAYEVTGAPSIFRDGFESGSTSAWSMTKP